ncbi:MAG: DUF488 family protein [Brachybacterium sp.]|nr:DUF488 family protein [Brachybacterium sp.]
MEIRLRRIYDDPSDEDGARVLVDRLWPRGVSKDRADLDAWIKDVAPSDDLRHWYGHDPAKFEEFAERYCHELDSDAGRAALQEVRDAATGESITLLTATKDLDLSHLVVLKSVLESTGAST